MSGKQMGKSVSVSRTCEAITSQHGDVISRCGAEMYKWLPTVDGETIAFCYDHALALGTLAIGWAFPSLDAYCTDCGGRPGDHGEECSLGDLAIKLPDTLGGPLGLSPDVTVRLRRIIGGGE